MKTYGIILAAGKQSRFNDDIPKALAEGNGKILLQHNYETLKNQCEKIYVVTSLENNHFFKDSLDKNDYVPFFPKNIYSSLDFNFDNLYNYYGSFRIINKEDSPIEVKRFKRESFK